MIYPPINQLVEKTGNKYELVIATAKRARVIANSEITKEKQAAEAASFMGTKAKADKNAKKPIIKAINEIVEGKVYVVRNDEGYKTEGFETKTAIEQAFDAE